MEFLMQQVFSIAGFPVVVWHVCVAVAVVVLLIILFVGLCQPRKKQKTAQQQPTAEPTQDTTDDPVEEVIVTIEEDSDDTVYTTDQVADTCDTVDCDPDTVDSDDTADQVADQTPTEQPDQTPAEQPTAPKKPTVKNYHISLRPDGKWQVKLSKGGKAIKLFRTQAEAIAFAKSRAKSQDGRITIHKVDGKIRKQKY